MVSRNSYAQDYVEHCRANIGTQVGAYRDLIAAAEAVDASGKTPLSSAIGKFEPLFLNNTAIILDALFCRRSRTMEGRDGKPLNEVKVLRISLMLHDGRLCADRPIRPSATVSVPKLQVGDEIRLDESDSRALAAALFAEIEAEYV
jgi:hypothetical protein